MLVTTLTKKMAEDLTDYLLELGIRVRYLHSEVDTLRRVELLQRAAAWASSTSSSASTCSVRAWTCPRCPWSRSWTPTRRGSCARGTSLIQTIGRAARNVSGQVHMYADTITPSMRNAIDETNRRRAKQVAYNKAHGLDPQPLRKRIADITDRLDPRGSRHRRPAQRPHRWVRPGPVARRSRRCPAAAAVARAWLASARTPGTTSTLRRWPGPSSPT